MIYVARSTRMGWEIYLVPSIERALHDVRLHRRKGKRARILTQEQYQTAVNWLALTGRTNL